MSFIYKQNFHSNWCASLHGSPLEPCNCPCSEEIDHVYFTCRICGNRYGTKHGLETHQRMKKHFH